MKNFQAPLSLVALLVFLTVIVDFMSKLSEEDVQVTYICKESWGLV